MTADPGSGTSERRARLTQNLRISEATFLASSLVHELSQPLSAINAWSTTCLDLAKQDGSRERLEKRLESLVQEAHRSTEIIRGFRNVLSQRCHEFAEIDLCAFLPQLAGLLKEEAARAGVTVSLDQASERCAVTADPALVEMAIYLLFRNSLEALEQHRRQSGEVVIKWRAKGNGPVTVTIEDTGPGIAEAVASRIFEPFVSTRENGVGLGLALCRTAVESLGGKLWLVSSSDSGAAFAFELPAAPDGKRTER